MEKKREVLIAAISLIILVVIITLIYLFWMDDRKFGILGGLIGGGIITSIIWLYRLKKK